MSKSITMPADLAEVIAVHRALFGGFTMTAGTTEPPAGDGGDGAGEGDQTAEKIFTQAEVDRIIADRLKRDDVKGLKAKAAEYDKLLDAQKTAEQKASEAQQAAEKRATEAEALVIRYRVAADKGISKEDADLFMVGTDEETITAQADRLIARDGEKKKRGLFVPNEGRQPKNQSKDDPKREFLRTLTGRDD